MEQSSTPKPKSVLAQEGLRNGSLILAMVVTLALTQLLFATGAIPFGREHFWNSLSMVLAVTVGSIILCRGGGLLIALTARAKTPRASDGH